jgi:hypothetical protein
VDLGVVVVDELSFQPDPLDLVDHRGLLRLMRCYGRRR